jgi:hypothetical protein
MHHLSTIQESLRLSGREDLACLLERARFRFREGPGPGRQARLSSAATVEVHSPEPDRYRLEALREPDRSAILRAFEEAYPPRAGDIEIDAIEFR